MLKSRYSESAYGRMRDKQKEKAEEKKEGGNDHEKKN